MKKLSHILSLLLVSFLLNGCTLMMEDFEIPEEERGVDEPYTEVLPDDMGTVTYQYNEGVMYIGSDKLSNIAQVEADSVLYFYNYVAEEDLPSVGQYLASGCSRTIPHGLNNRVLSVEDVGGLYKVVTTRATIDEVYKELDYEVSFDHDHPEELIQEMPDSATLDSLGQTPEDYALTDWSIVDGTNPALVRKRRMRASNDDDYEETKRDEGTSFSWSIDTRLALGDDAQHAYSTIEKSLHKNLRKLLDNPYFPDNFYVAAKIDLSTSRTMYAKRVEKDDYEISYTDTKESKTFILEAGVDVGVSFIDKFKKNPETGYNVEAAAAGKFLDDLIQGDGIDKFQDCIEKIKDKKFPLQKGALDLKGIYIPIGGAVPLEFYVQPGFDVGLNVSFAGGIAFKSTCTTRSGYEVKDGKQTKIQKVLEKKSENSVYMQGKGEISVEAGCEVGVRFALTLCAGVYGYVKAGAEASVNFEPFGEYKIANDGSIIRLFAEFGGKATFHVAPLGLELWEKSLSFPSLTFYENKWQATPQIDTGPVPGSISVDPTGATLKYAYNIKKSGFLCNDFSNIQYKLLIYKGAIDPSVLVATIDASSGSTKTHKSFEYKISSSDYNKNDIYVGVPYIESIGMKVAYTDLAYAITDPVPKVEIVALSQDETKELSSYADFEGYDGALDGGDDGSGSSSYSDFVKYKFATMVSVAQRGLMKDWGIRVLVSHPTKGELIYKKIPINRKKSGTYTINMSFITNYKPNGSSKKPLNVVVVPYCTDLNGETYTDDPVELNLEFPFDGHFQSDGTQVDINLN